MTKPAGLQPLVVTGDAVLREHGGRTTAAARVAAGPRAAPGRRLAPARQTGHASGNGRLSRDAAASGSSRTRRSNAL